MARNFSFILLFAILIVIGCNPVQQYKAGGFGSVNGGDAGNGSAIVTISGSVMSSTTFQSINSQALGTQGFSAFQSALYSIVEASQYSSPLLSSSAAISSNACADATWSMSYVGGGGEVIKTGRADVDGAFEVPSVPAGKEAVIVFNCGTTTQKCLVKGGDAGKNCNAIADGVVGALEASLGKNLTSPDLAAKSVANVASSIVEATNSDSADAETLKTAVTTCKALTDEAAKKLCYKNSFMSSSQSATFEVVKTLANSWDVRSLFNFVIGTAGMVIEVDDFLYTDLGIEVDRWLNTNFVSQTKGIITDLINNPDYVQGDSSKGEQVLKLECQMWYTKYQSGGQTTFTPTTIAGIPSCANANALAELANIPVNDSRITNFISAINNGGGGGGGGSNYQLGTPGDDNGNGVIDGGESPVSNACSNNSWSVKGNFCVEIPKLYLRSRVTEADRNDISGDFSTNKFNFDNRVSLVSASEAVDDTIAELDSISRDPSLSPSDYRKNCALLNPSGPPVIANNTNCKDWVNSYMSPIKNEFSGLIGAYIFLSNPSTYNLNQTKLSLMDIHKVFSKSNLMNSKLFNNSKGQFTQVKSSFSSGGDTRDLWMPPLVNTRSVNNLFIPDVFVWNPNNGNNQVTVSLNAFNTLSSNGTLYDRFSLTFQPFLIIPNTTQIQTMVQNSSHHEPWNPLGQKLYDIPGIQRPTTNFKYPIYCKMTNRKRLDDSGNPLPMVKELSKSTKIECLADPWDSGVTLTATEGLFNVPSNFAYPFVLQSRGYQGEGKGSLMTLIDRKTGQPLRIGGTEIMILEGLNGNSSVMVEGTCGTGFSEPSNSSDAPIVKVRYTYGGGSNSRSEIITAYCLNMSSVVQSDNNTRPYFAGEINVSGFNGTFKMPLVGGRLITDPGFNLNPVCLFSSNLTFNFNGTLGRNIVNYSGAGTPPTVSSPFVIQGFNNNEIITSLGDSANIIDYCSQSHGGTTKYYLRETWTGNFYDVTNSSVRDSFPLGLIKASDNSVVDNIYIRLGAVEDHYVGGTLTIANINPRTWFYPLKILNQRHNPKFDPFCDDVGDGNGGQPDGICNCFDGAIPNTNVLKADQNDCNLGDRAAEPTISNAPYWQHDPNVNSFRTFFSNYGGKSGSELSRDHDNNPSTPNIPLDDNYLFSNQLWMRLEEILICKFKNSAGEVVKPTQIVRQNLASQNFPGCPDSNGLISSTPSGAWPPSVGGGPVRVIKPVQMKNAYDISYPKKFMTLLNFATKTIGQGVTIDPNKKQFTFEEAVAFIEMRKMLPPNVDALYNQQGAPMQDYSLSFGTLYTQDEPQDTIGGVFFGITKPTMLNNP
jgi:hypothetical protein